ncbi:TetR/AcrR family transcriptional regulator [Nonomuraea rubra]|uniref:TetR/AcrR family transcriptional regulator n=1 Tax=Nonomuraea rubra TaxID=46180 RepID=UPI003621843A
MEGRRDRKKRQTRERIQASALELFTSQGYRNTTIAAIAEHADVATRTVTLHFPTKEDLLFADDPFPPSPWPPTSPAAPVTRSTAWASGCATRCAPSTSTTPTRGASRARSGPCVPSAPP